MVKIAKLENFASTLVDHVLISMSVYVHIIHHYAPNLILQNLFWGYFGEIYFCRFYLESNGRKSGTKLCVAFQTFQIIGIFMEHMIATFYVPNIPSYIMIPRALKLTILLNNP